MLGDESQIINSRALKEFRDIYLTVGKHKAFAQTEDGKFWNWFSDQNSTKIAIENALLECLAKRYRRNSNCLENISPCRRGVFVCISLTTCVHANPSGSTKFTGSFNTYP
ncbi:MAG: hypothetical protein LBB59_08890 [Campylobacteraceae bacterium]|nr:hypothetical protein [Campylobacteraceae bacterium]